MRVLFLSEAPLIRYGLKAGFDQLGYKTSYLDKECSNIVMNSTEKHIQLIMNRVEEFKPDLIFTEGYSFLPLHKLYPEFKEKGIQTHVWCIEDPVTPHIGNYLANNSDFAWTTTLERVKDYNLLGKKSDVLLFGCNPEFHKPALSEDRFKHDISLVARNYSNRYDKTEWFVLPFIKYNYDVKIYGRFWLDKNRPINLIGDEWAYWREDPYIELPYEWLNIVINSSKIILGMNCSDQSITQTSMRPYETLASSENSLLLAHYTKAQEKIFTDHIYQAKDTDEALQMANEILRMSDKQRKEKAKKAREFVVKNHNYKLRAQQIIDIYYKI